MVPGPVRRVHSPQEFDNAPTGPHAIQQEPLMTRLGFQTNDNTKRLHGLFCPRAHRGCAFLLTCARTESRGVGWGAQQDTLHPGQKEPGQAEGHSTSTLQVYVAARHGTGLRQAKPTPPSTLLGTDGKQENENLYLCLLLYP